MRPNTDEALPAQSVASGALLCYCLSAVLGPAVLSRSEVWQHRIDRWADRIKEHDQNLLSYLIVLRWVSPSLLMGFAFSRE